MEKLRLKDDLNDCTYVFPIAAIISEERIDMGEIEVRPRFSGKDKENLWLYFYPKVDKEIKIIVNPIGVLYLKGYTVIHLNQYAKYL